jgi:hypothetical protein
MLAGLLLGACMVGGLLLRFPMTAPAPDHRLPLDPACTLGEGECSRPLPGGGELGLRLDPPRPEALRPFQVELRVYGGEARRVEFAVRGADGALDRVRLQRSGPGRWQGQGMLSWCGTAEMVATAVVESGGREWRVPFAFDMEPAR